jgi:hypothetical protein
MYGVVVYIPQAKNVLKDVASYFDGWYSTLAAAKVAFQHSIRSYPGAQIHMVMRLMSDDETEAVMRKR